jgi:HipA-like C-terminal domain
VDEKLTKLLAREGPLSAPEAADRLHVTPMTINNRAKAIGSNILVLGRGKHTRYALPNNNLTGQSQWRLYWVDVQGELSELAIVSYVQPDTLHVYGRGVNTRTDDELPWFLWPLKLRGYLGRAAKYRLGSVARSWDSHPEKWPLAQQVFAAQSEALEHAGAILWGEDSVQVWQKSTKEVGHSEDEKALLQTYDDLADRTTAGQVAGSSADGEQAKFSTLISGKENQAREVLVKFSPPHGTPFGDRWRDLLHSEAIAADVLRDFGFDTPQTRALSSDKRTFLESARIDRNGTSGRRHLLPLFAVHKIFTPGDERNWIDTVARLASQKRISNAAVETTQTLYSFGQLIGNSDMHFGNLGVILLSPADISKGRFTLAPCYDMLPMRFKPEAHSEFSYTHFSAELSPTLPKSVTNRALEMAREFWLRVSDTSPVSAKWREFALERANLL